jgi:hypothetical protein
MQRARNTKVITNKTMVTQTGLHRSPAGRSLSGTVFTRRCSACRVRESRPSRISKRRMTSVLVAKAVTVVEACRQIVDADEQMSDR